MTADFCVIGGGIAGLSIAYELRGKAKVLVLEKETDLSYHSTGRSAALYSEFIATPLALALSKLSRPFLTSPPAVFSKAPLHRDIGCVFTATGQQATLIRAKMAQHAEVQLLDQEQLSAVLMGLSNAAIFNNSRQNRKRVSSRPLV
ncbi:MAG: D-arginine dehydrogenase [Halioglobus sp.]|jgi:glycine/D-amino acid oxidase-like deaminating enzyme